MNLRWLIAFDGKDFYVRRILCITHHGESGEVQYDAKPAPLTKKRRESLLKYLRVWDAIRG